MAWFILCCNVWYCKVQHIMKLLRVQYIWVQFSWVPVDNIVISLKCWSPFGQRLLMNQCSVEAVKVDPFSDEQIQSNNICLTPALCEYTCSVLLTLAWLRCACFGSVVHRNCYQLEMLFLLSEMNSKSSPISTNHLYTHKFDFIIIISLLKSKWWCLSTLLCHLEIHSGMGVIVIVLS